jgi:L-fucose isomerase
MVVPSEEEYDTFVAARGSHQLPTAFVHVDLDFEALIDEFGSNHVSGVAGNYVQELKHVCDLLDIQAVVLGK